MELLKGEVIEAIKDEPDRKVRATLKGAEVAKMAAVGRHQVGKNEIEIVALSPIAGGVSVLARVFDEDGQQMGFGPDGSVDIERFLIFNPPIFVPDGTRTPDLVNGTPGRSNYKEDPVAALAYVIAHTAKISAKKGKIVEGKIGNTTSTFFPTLDGRRFRNGATEAFATARAGADTGGSNGDTDNVGPEWRASAVLNQYGGNVLARMFFTFDTSAIPDTDEVSAASFSWKTDLATNGLGGPGVGCCSWNGTENFAVANWGDTPYNTAFPYGSINTDGATYNDIEFLAAGIAAINKSGDTMIGFRDMSDLTNVEPTWSINGEDRTKTFFSEFSGGTTDDPKLTVVHAAASGPAASRRIINAG